MLRARGSDGDAVTTTRRAAEALAKKLGATIEAERVGSTFTVRAMAPRGMHWSARGVHELVESGRPTTSLQRNETWLALLQAMEMGLEACDLNDPDCAEWALE